MRIDHIELFVSDRQEAVEWYGRVLGFEAMQEHLDWAKKGPLMMTNDGGDTMLALFQGPPQGDAEVKGFRRVAFRVGAAGLIEFLESSASWRNQPLVPADVMDHGKSWSVYFADPFGSLLEVTTYEYAEAKRLLAR